MAYVNIMTEKERRFTEEYRAAKRLSGKAETVALARLASVYGEAWLAEAEQTYEGDLQFLMTQCYRNKSVRRNWKRFSLFKDE